MLKKMLVGAGTLAAALAVATPAHAAFWVQISDGATTTSVIDNGAGDLNPLVGSILVAGSVGGFAIAGDISTSNAPGSTSSGFITTNVTVSASPAAGGTLTVTTSDSGFTNPGGIGTPMVLTSSLSGTGASVASPATVTYHSYANSPAVLWGTGNPTPTQTCNGLTGVLSTQCAAAAVATGSFFRASSTYSLTNSIAISLAGALDGTIQVTGTTAATVPEPGSMLLLGTGLFGVARFARRRFNLV